MNLCGNGFIASTPNQYCFPGETFSQTRQLGKVRKCGTAVNEIVNTNERQNPDLNDPGTTSVIPFTKPVTNGKAFTNPYG